MISSARLPRFDAPVPGLQPLRQTETLHLWQGSLDLSLSRVEALGRALSASDRSRAERFHVEPDCRRFVAGRGFLRLLLSRYVGQAPETLKIVYGNQGKPHLLQPLGQRLEFNVSHSSGLALYAVSLDRRVGVDVERIRPVSGVDKIVRRFFTEGEHTALSALDGDAKRLAFFTYWTRKEACLKACEEGISQQLRLLEMAWPRGAGRLIETTRNGQHTERWFVEEVSVPPSFVAAVATEAPNRKHALETGVERMDRCADYRIGPNSREAIFRC